MWVESHPFLHWVHWAALDITTLSRPAPNTSPLKRSASSQSGFEFARAAETIRLRVVTLAPKWEMVWPRAVVKIVVHICAHTALDVVLARLIKTGGLSLGASLPPHGGNNVSGLGLLTVTMRQPGFVYDWKTCRRQMACQGCLPDDHSLGLTFPTRQCPWPP